ncbi:MAG: DUF924 domain-containing protein [Betaproteobacteria bacterium]|nr:DUF924 domain-containing protein [Betaproteobacteria bacterium]
MLDTKHPRAADVLRFWFGVYERSASRDPRWFRKDPAFDAEIVARFRSLHEQGANGKLSDWSNAPGDCLALAIVLDQFPRNMFRGKPRAFATDFLALDAARHAVDAGYDTGMRPAERMFLYLPFEHSESLDDQWRSLALMSRLATYPETDDVFEYAVRHWEIVRRFGRFPHRNAALARTGTPEETEFLKQPGSGF